MSSRSSATTPAHRSMPGARGTTPVETLGQLFSYADSRRTAQKNKARPRRASTVTDELYPMYVLPVKVLLKLTKLLPHQDMLKTGRLVRVTPQHAGKIIFVSHEWTGFSMPDPNGVQLQCLQTLLRRLMAGEEDGVQSHWQMQMAFGSNTRIRAKDWKKHLEHMYIWIDYCSMPQPTAGPMPAEGEIREFSDGDDENLGLATDELATSPAAQLPSNEGTDHRFGGDALSDALTKAVESIPSYVERSSLMLVLVPTTSHTGRIGDTCDFRSWRGRGWCRMEFMCALVARHDLELIVVEGAAITPYLCLPYDSLKLPAGMGAFTCCAKNHDFGGGPGTAPCDKHKVRRVLAQMIDAKAGHLFELGHMFEARYFVALKHYLLRGLPGGEGGGGSGSGESLAALKARLRWRDEDTEHVETKRTGLGLVCWAAVADNAAAVREVLAPMTTKERGEAVNRGAVRDHPKFMVMKGMNSLMFAMSFAQWDVVEVLLDVGGADTALRTKARADPLFLAAMSGQADNITAWLQRFPEWNVDSREPLVGMTPLMNAVGIGSSSEKLPTLEALLAAGANPSNTDYFGATLLINAAQNPDADAILVRRLLDIPEVAQSIDRKQIPRSLLSKVFFGVARLAVRLGSKNGLFGYLARVDRGTALHYAAEQKNVVMAQVLVEEGRADKKVRSRQGKTPVELAHMAIKYRGLASTPAEIAAVEPWSALSVDAKPDERVPVAQAGAEPSDLST